MFGGILKSDEALCERIQAFMQEIEEDEARDLHDMSYGIQENRFSFSDK
jgi:hypothetical protein